MKLFARYFFLIVIYFACPKQVLTQTHRIDSLENDLRKVPDDSVKVFLLIGLANQYFSYDSLKAYRYLENGYILVKKLRWDYATAFYYDNNANIKQYSNNNDAADLNFDTAIIYYQKTADSKRDKKEVANAKLSIATCKGQKGDILLAKGKSKEAITAYIEALEMWKTSEDPQKQFAIAIYYTKISTVYANLTQFNKSLEYDKLSLVLFQELNYEEGIGWAAIYVCRDFNALSQIDSAMAYLAIAKPFVERLNNFRLNIQYYNKLAQISFTKKNYKESINYFNKVITAAKENNNELQVFSSQKMIGSCYIKLGDFPTARKYLLLALPSVMKSSYESQKIEILENLVDVEEKTNNRAQAFIYLKQLTAIKDSATLEASKKAVAEIENKYQAAEKEKEIIQLQKDKQIQSLSLKQKSTLNYFLLTLLAALIIVGFLGYRNFYHRHQLAKKQDELQQQRISELEKDKQLVAVDFMLKGQEEERSRLAKDLHDGLGGLLSGVKFSLSNMKDNLIITPDNMAVFERSLDMIDNSIKELRRVAHNMMPELLAKFGLDEALKEYCNTINATNLLPVKYQSMGMDTRLEKSVEIIIYRIIQELLNNIMKHAAATEAIVQLIKEEGRFSIIVEDNGKGFDMSLLKTNKGAGLINIQSRVDYLKGRLDIHSEAGKGTLVNIEFTI